MPTPSLTHRHYQTLLKQIKSLIEHSRRMVEMQTVQTYWNIGRSIEEYTGKFDRKAIYGRNIYLQLSEDLKVHEKVLYQSVQFFKAYPKLNFKLPLNWTHYRYLSQIDDPRQRLQWEKRIIRENLGTKRFQVLLYEQRNALKGGAEGRVLPQQRGMLYHYRLIKVNFATQSPEGIMVDCGFEVRIVPPPGGGELVNKRIVRSQKNNEGLYELRKSNTRVGELFTYAALIERVIDGDTLLANIDCGFGIWTRQRLRLRGIDAPERETIAGKHTLAWVKDRLSLCPFIIVKTYKSDKYDRYLVDVFYLPKEKDQERVAQRGKYLNQELLDEGLAGMYK